MEVHNNDFETDITRIQKLLSKSSNKDTNEENSEIDSSDNSDLDDDFTIDDEVENNDNWTRILASESLDNSYYDAEPTLKNCYRNNLKYQVVLTEAIRDLEMELLKNKEMQGALIDRLSKANNEKPSTSISWFTFCTPYFKDRSGHIPPRNEDVKRKAENKEWSTVTQPLPWTAKEEEMLCDAIKVNGIEIILNPKMAKCEVLLTEMNSELYDKATIQIKQKELLKTQKELEELRKKASDQLPFSRDFDYDWMKISALDFDGVRNPTEIKLYWRNYLHPIINKKKWGFKELDSLKNLVKNNIACDWEAIAVQLQTNRTGLQCCGKYNLKFNINHKRIWTQEEKNQIMKLVEELRIGDYIPWQKIADQMEGRTIKQIWHQYNYVINPNIKRGKWNLEEDVWLVAAVWLLGLNNFWTIKKYVLNRTNRQCLDRWNSNFDPKLKFGKWTSEEDEKILELVKEHGNQWALIRGSLPGRTGSMIHRRYNNLIKETQLRQHYKVGCVEEYQHRVFRYVYTCLNKIAKSKRWKRIDGHSKFKNSFLHLNLDAPTLALRQHLFQLPVEEFRDLFNPTVLENNIYKTVSIDDELHSYLSFFHSGASKGRPFKMIKVDEKGEDFKTHMSGLISVMRPKISSHDGKLFFPPMIKTMYAFRSLLLLKNRLFQMRRRNNHDESRELERIRGTDAYEKLFERFASLFFWPAVMSVLKPESFNTGIDRSDKKHTNCDILDAGTSKKSNGRKNKKRKVKPKEKSLESNEPSVKKSDPKPRKRRKFEASSALRKSTRIAGKSNMKEDIENL